MGSEAVPTAARSAPLRLCADGTAIVHLDRPGAGTARALLETIAERGPRDGHTALYQIHEESLWQAAARGRAPAPRAVLATLASASPLPVPAALARRIEGALTRTASLRLYADATGALWLARTEAGDTLDLRSLARTAAVRDCLLGAATPDRAPVRPDRRYALRAALLRLGYPVRDMGAAAAAGRAVRVREDAQTPRPYQVAATEALFAQPAGGVVVLPCGAGKTLVGVLAIARSGVPALVVVPHHEAASQWRACLLGQTGLSPADVRVYRGPGDVAPVTLVTYAMLATRSGDARPHLRRLAERTWSIVVFDEVHLLPAPVFALSAVLPAQRRLGLSATLVREDGHQGDVLALVGPVVYALEGAALEQAGFLARATCEEVRVPLPEDLREQYLRETAARRLRMAADNPAKDGVAARLVSDHAASPCLVLGQYLSQLERLGQRLGAPVVTGRSPREERERLYAAFRAGALGCLVLSKVGNLAVDLPAASVAIQVSGSFGSRQEEAQRLGRVLRPKPDGGEARFYSLVTAQSREVAFAAHRARYLVAQGYGYTVRDAGGLQ